MILVYPLLADASQCAASLAARRDWGQHGRNSDLVSDAHVAACAAGCSGTQALLPLAGLQSFSRCFIQNKEARGVDGAFGSSQTIYYEDRKRLPYTNAVIHEIQRFANVAPMGIPRQCVRDTKVQGLLIRKGTILLASLCSSLQDPGHWDTPLSFNPGHFLDKDGNFQGNAAFLPFSAGHRVCMGQQLAKSKVFHFFTSLVRGFSFRLPHGVTEVNLKPVFASTLQPYPYQICAIPR
ncbi:hypothetical protein FKM82_018984 [Ascaphus truei]